MESSVEYRNTVLYAPGLRQPVQKASVLFNELEKDGAQIIDPPNGRIISSSKLDEEFHNRTDEWPFIQLSKANMLHRAIVESGVSSVDVIGYCEGGVTSTILAQVHPEEVGQLVLVNPAGMTKESSPDRLVGRFRDKNRRYRRLIAKEIISGNFNHSTRYKIWSNVNRTLGMAALASLAEVYMPEVLEELAGNGMKISIIQGFRDTLYPYDSVNPNVPGNIYAHASFADRTAGHDVLTTHATSSSRAVIDLLKG